MEKRKTGSSKRLNWQKKDLLEHFFTVPRLNNTEIALVLHVDEGTIRHRKRQFQETGTLSPKRTTKNAEKLRPWHLEKILELLEQNDQLLIKDIQEFLRREYHLDVSISTISRQLKRAQKPRNQRSGYKGNKMVSETSSVSRPTSTLGTPHSIPSRPQSQDTHSLTGVEESGPGLFAV